MFSEGAQDKVYRQTRLHHPRKMSRLVTNEDVMRLLLAQSEPYIYKFRNTSKTFFSLVNEAVLSLLKSG